MYDAAESKNLIFSSTNVLIQLKSGAIAIMNGSAYTKTKFKFNSNYRYHFRVKMNVATKKYSVWMTPIHPTKGEEVLVAENYSFRASAPTISDIGQIILVAAEPNGTYWIENHTVTEG